MPNTIIDIIRQYTREDIIALRAKKRQEEIAQLMQIRIPGRIREAKKEAKAAKRNWTQVDMALRMGLGQGIYKGRRARPAQTKKRVDEKLRRAYYRIENNWGDDIPMCLLVLYVLGEVPHE